MNDQLAEIIHQNLDLALSYGYAMTSYFCLIEKDGHYIHSNDMCLSCHPLETVIIGQEITDCINVDVAKNLGVSLHWIAGFVDAYGHSEKNEVYAKLFQHDIARKRYIEGFCDGEEVESWLIALEG